jgi:hypothetical protein
MQSCLQARGWDVTFEQGVIVSDTLPDAQANLYDADQQECGDETGFFDSFTADELHRLYKLEVDNHQCLLDSGFESAAPPSEQQYVDDWLNAQSGVSGIQPYESISLVVAANSPSQWNKATTACPPPLWAF